MGASFALDKVISTAGTTKPNPTPVSIQESNTRRKNSMKINRFIALAAIALMVVGAAVFMSTRAHAQAGNSPAQQAQVVQAPDNEAASLTPDTDNVQEEVGDQSGQQVEDGLPDSSGYSATESSGAVQPSTASSVSVAPSGMDLAAHAIQPKVNASSTLHVVSAPSSAASPSVAADTEDPSTGIDTDNIQQGDQSGQQVEDGQPDTAGAATP
jgi:hypothetical protein